jgi:leucyl/phenylalanyl-tRNA--protein transferase
MFAKVSDASKVAFAVLIDHLRDWGYAFVDCQVPTEHLKSLGAKEVSRAFFLRRLCEAPAVIEGENHWEMRDV